MQWVDANGWKGWPNIAYMHQTSPKLNRQIQWNTLRQHTRGGPDVYTILRWCMHTRRCRFVWPFLWLSCNFADFYDDLPRAGRGIEQLRNFDSEAARFWGETRLGMTETSLGFLGYRGSRPWKNRCFWMLLVQLWTTWVKWLQNGCKTAVHSICEPRLRRFVWHVPCSSAAGIGVGVWVLARCVGLWLLSDGHACPCHV